MKQHFLLVLFVLFGHSVFSQETNLRFMTYNLLRYGANNAFCNPDCKDQNLKIIFNEAKPDLITVNEVLDNGNNANIFADRIIANTLNVDGVTAWKKGEVYTNTGQGITNALFYNSEKIQVVSMKRIAQTRAAVYKCYFKSSTLETLKDTVFFYVVPVHLKAGSTDSDIATRRQEAQEMIAIFKANPAIKNLFLMGDCNLKGASEPAFQVFTQTDNGSVQLKDPINQVGAWNANKNFASVHTQSPRTQTESDGGSTGGMDDRFDLILVNNAVMTNAENIQYVTGTYHPIGNDGTVFNKSILEAQTVASELKNALYRNSDHVPVIAGFSFKGVLTGVYASLMAQYNLSIIQNPVSESLRLRISVSESKTFTYRWTNLLGQTVRSGAFSVEPSDTEANLNASDLPAGVWLLTVSDAVSGSSATFKVVKE